eukprot:s2886_g9.t1
MLGRALSQSSGTRRAGSMPVAKRPGRTSKMPSNQPVTFHRKVGRIQRVLRGASCIYRPRSPFGRCVSPGKWGWGHPKSEALAEMSTRMKRLGTADGPLRPLCKFGTKCYRRNPEHLKEQAHPWDPDYLACCAACNHSPEFVSIRMLFEWIESRDETSAERGRCTRLAGKSFAESHA